ncbi:hypothetical protein J5277_09300 [Rhizobium sp. 16-449-1b]|uniref:hypothetical protein n=1 Tax=Rhizobium sp. 16-449-1b TaxID=2819989 RepID=UPI001ADBCCDE|nr:hypothetical protein [Rhizobium sp. 16-449-1b]MBO9194300.1 hypothetical protein [Rhizobium sp. 16-449-1b]
MTSYVMIKRDLYECPSHLGYTGIRDNAGQWDDEYILAECVDVRDAYDPKELEHYALPFDKAPEFTKTSFHDLNEAHLRGKITELQAANDNLREALTPSGSTKAAYHGEFKFSQTAVDEDGDEYSYSVYVPWTTVKEIMAAIAKRAGIKEAA